jgi:hypothetical protein
MNGQITVENGHQFFRRLLFAETGEAADVGKDGGDVGALAAQLQFVRVELVNDRR